MRFVKTPLEGAIIVEMESIEDERGFFARSFCIDEFKQHGLDYNIAQCNVSFNRKAGTLRGMHFQAEPHEEAKLVRCTMGSIFDVIVDLREHSSTRYQWFGNELTSENRLGMFVPAGFAHWFQTLSDNSEVTYQMSDSYHPPSGCGQRWDDLKLGIRWPFADPLISEKDRGFALVSEAVE
jgi:dTDP-4-dehydrorhamnose 3,5-epimerase